MTIKVRSKKKKIWLRLVVPISLAVFGISKAAERNDENSSFKIKLDKQTKREIKDKLVKAKKNFGRLVLVDVQAFDGSKIKITL